jgi:hypothetical protein
MSNRRRISLARYWFARGNQDAYVGNADVGSWEPLACERRFAPCYYAGVRAGLVKNFWCFKAWDARAAL